MAIKSLTSAVQGAINEAGTLTAGKLLTILNSTLPNDREVAVVDKTTARGNTTSQLAKVYSALDYSKDIVISEQVVTEGLFPAGAGTMLSGSFFSSSLQNASSSLYYTTVMDGDTTASNAVFDIAYTSLDSLVSSSQTLYRQLANVLLTANDDYFTFNTGIDVRSLIVVSLKRARYNERLDQGNWMLRMFSASSTMSFTDDSTNTVAAKTSVGDRLYIVSGSIGTVVGTNKWGFCYPDLGLLVFDGDQFATSCSYSASLDFMRNMEYFQARNETRLKDINYFVRVYNKDYNYSNNPTFYTSSTGKYMFSEFIKDPHIFITTVGLYNDANELLAVARLSKPVEKTFEKEAIFRCRLSFGIAPIFLIPIYYSIMNSILFHSNFITSIINWIKSIF